MCNNYDFFICVFTMPMIVAAWQIANVDLQVKRHIATNSDAFEFFFEIYFITNLN
jgi:hypothetical protein